MSLIDDVIDWLARQGEEAYLVGGCVRDRLLGRPVYDLDVALGGDGLRLARRLANAFQGAYYPLDEARSTGRAILDDGGRQFVVDVARLRGPGLAEDLADRDFTINALAAPLSAPDEIIDRHGGRADLEARLIRPVSDESVRNDPVRALRAVRFAAVLAPLGFRLAPETETLIRRDGAGLAGVAGERVRDELARILALPWAAGYIAELDRLGLLAIILPELGSLRGLAQPRPHTLDALAHSLETVFALEAILSALTGQGGHAEGGLPSVAGPPLQDYAGPPRQDSRGVLYAARIAPYVSLFAPHAAWLGAHLARVISDARRRLVVVKLAALMHDVGKAPARGVDDAGRVRFIGHEVVGGRMVGAALRRLRFDGGEARLGETIVRHHMRPLLLAARDGVSARAVYRFFRDTGDAGIDVAVLALADQLATIGPVGEEGHLPEVAALAERLLADYWADGGRRVSPPRLIDGADLQRELGLEPGPRIGELLEAVREAQAAGEVRTSAEALALARRLAG